MPRSSKDVDDDEEPRSGRIYTRKCAAQSVVDSPLRRSSRIKQTMESISIETLKGTRYTKRTSFSSDINDTPDVDIGTFRRTTRRGGTTTFSPSTRVTRTLNKRLTRAGSETKSPPVSPSLRRCRTRASSVDIESVSVQNQYESDIPLKLHKQVTMLPSCSSLKDGEEKKLTYLNDIISETEEYTNIENIDSSSSQIIHMDKKDKKESLDTEEYNSEECLPHDAIVADEDTPDKFSSPLKKEKNDKIDNKISELSEVQVSLIDICKTEKELGGKMENMLNISIEEEKRSPSNKENQTLNVINSTVMKSLQSITTLPSSSTDSLTSFASISKTLNEKENKSVLNEVSLSKKLYDSTKAAIKHSTLSKDIDSNEEKTDISINSLSLNLTDSKNDNSLKSDTSEKQSSNHDVNGESSVDNTNKLLLLEGNTVDVIEESIVTKETSIKNISEFFEDTTDIVEASNKKDKNKNSKKSSVTETYKMSHLSINEISDTCDSTSSLILIQSLDNSTKIIEERRPCPSENKILSIVDQSIADHTKQLNTNDAEILPLNDKSCEDNQSTILQSIVSQVDISDNDNFLKQNQQMLHEQSDYSAFPEMNFSFKKLNDGTIQDNQSLDILKTSVKSVTEIAKDNSDVDIGIELFQDVPAETWEKKMAKRNNEVESSSQLPKNLDTRPECDLVLIDKQAWFETKNEETKQELLEYDSDDIFKNQSEAAENASFSDAKNLSISNQKMDLNEKTKTIKLNKKRKLLTKRKSVSQEDKNSSNEREKEEDSLNIFNTSSEQPETEEVDQCKDQVVLNLTRSEQVNTIEQTSEKHDTSNEEEEDDDTGRLHRSLPASKKVTPLRKSTERRKSLNKSVKDTSLKQSNMQEVNQSQINASEENLDNISTHIKKKTKKKHSLNKSNNMDAYNNLVTEREKISPSKDNIEEDENTLINHSVNKKLKSLDTNNISVNLNDEINDVNVICTIDLGFKNTLAKSPSDFADSSNSSENVIPQFLFSQSSDDDSNNSIDLDIKREYNLSGVEQKLPDDVPADECRDSEEEFSDPDDHGSDLVDFIVDDSNDDMASEKIEEENNEDVEEEGIENEDEQYIIENNEIEEKEAENDQQACKNIEYCTESDNEEDADEENDEIENKYKKNPAEIMKITDVIKKSNINKKKKSKRQSIETISPNDSKIKQNVKLTKSSMNKTEETLIKQINTIEPKKFKSPVAILGYSISNFNLQNKNSPIVVPELQSDNCNSSNVKINNHITFLDMETNDQNVKKDLKNKYIKLDKTDKSIQNTSAKKQKSKISVKRDIKLKELNYTNGEREKQILSANSANDVIQESSQRKQRKRKRQNEIWDKDAADELIVQDANELNELNIFKKKKRVKIDSMSNTKNTSCEYTCYVKGKEKNQKHKDDKIANNSKTNSDDNYMHVMEQIMCQKTEEKKDILPKQLSQKKKKKEDSSSLQTKVLKLKSENLESTKIRNSELEPTSSKVRNKGDFSANYKILKKIKCQKIAEIKESLSEQLLGKKKKNIKNTLLLQPEVIKSDILKSDKHASKLADPTEPQNEETNSSTNNYMVMKKKQKEQKIGNSKEPLLKTLKKKKKAKKILPSEIGISTLKEQKTTDNKDTSEKLLKRKKKAKQISLLETSPLKSDNLQLNELKELQVQNYNKLDLAVSLKTQGKKQDSSTLSYEDMYKKLERQKTVKSREYLTKKLLEKKRKKEEASILNSKVPKIKPGTLLSHDMSYIDESISTFEVRDKALKVIHATDMHITANEELKKKIKKRKLEDNETNIDQDKNEKSAKKKRKEEKVKENNCLLSSTETLKRLPDSMIMDLANMPMKKKRKLSQNEKHVKNIGKSMTATGENSIPSSSCSNHISGFTVVNLEKTKKQQLSKRSATVISARQHISTKNREPVSAYISYLQKQRATSKNKFTSNAF